MASYVLAGRAVCYILRDMKDLQFIALIACAAFLVSCESIDTAGNPNGRENQEAKRLAAVQQQSQQPPPDEAQQNLWNAQQDILNRDGNPVRRY
jgi:hypothetical protein